MYDTIQKRQEEVKKLVLSDTPIRKILSDLNISATEFFHDIRTLDLMSYYNKTRKYMRYEIDERNKCIINDFKNGMTKAKLADKYALTIYTIQDITKSVDIHRQTKTNLENDHSDIIRDYVNGIHDLNELSKKYNRKIQSIRNILKEKGNISTDKYGNQIGYQEDNLSFDKYMMKAHCHYYPNMKYKEYESEIYSIPCIKAVVYFLAHHPLEEYPKVYEMCFNELFEYIALSKRRDLKELTKQFILEVRDFIYDIKPFMKYF